ncbi:MAG: hypothetical protein K5851_03315 [Lachnospiraceae bacterium]|nr:hypothetical protein [Lachnospiraceae bacterium]
MKERKNHIVGRTVFFSIVVMVLFCGYAIWQISKYEEGTAEIFAEEQDGYVSLVSKEIKNGKTPIENAADTVEVLDSDDDRFWTLDDKSTILYIKNVTETNQYRNVAPEKYYSSKSAKNFLDSLSENDVIHKVITIDGQKYIASGIIVSVNNKNIRMILLSDMKIVFSNNTYLSDKIFLETAVVSIAVLFIVVLILMSILISKEKEKTEIAVREIKELQDKIEDITEAVEVREELMKRTVSDTFEKEKETPKKSEVKGDMTISDEDYAKSHFIRNRKECEDLFLGLDERRIYPTTVLACRLRGKSVSDFYLEIKSVIKRDAIWISENDNELILVFGNKRKGRVMDFVWKHVVYQHFVVAYRLYTIEEGHGAIAVEKEIKEFFGA